MAHLLVSGNNNPDWLKASGQKLLPSRGLQWLTSRGAPEAPSPVPTNSTSSAYLWMALSVDSHSATSQPCSKQQTADCLLSKVINYLTFKVVIFN